MPARNSHIDPGTKSPRKKSRPGEDKTDSTTKKGLRRKGKMLSPTQLERGHYTREQIETIANSVEPPIAEERRGDLETDLDAAALAFLLRRQGLQRPTRSEVRDGIERIEKAALALLKALGMVEEEKDGGGELRIRLNDPPNWISPGDIPEEVYVAVGSGYSVRLEGIRERLELGSERDTTFPTAADSVTHEDVHEEFSDLARGPQTLDDAIVGLRRLYRGAGRMRHLKDARIRERAKKQYAGVHIGDADLNEFIEHLREICKRYSSHRNYTRFVRAAMNPILESVGLEPLSVEQVRERVKNLKTRGRQPTR